VTRAIALEVDGLVKKFGGVVAVNNVSFTVESGSITGLIGPNGSGKTVTFDCLTGFYTPDAGRVVFHGRDITRLRPPAIALSGIARSFQITGVFPTLTARESLLFAAQDKRLRRHLTGAAARAVPRRDVAAGVQRTLELIGLDAVADEPVEQLPSGHQKLVEFASLMRMNPEPALYMLDEPFAGLSVAEIARYVGLMRALQAQGKTFLIVEHNMRVMMKICDSITVLDYGQRIATGPPAAIQADPRVAKAYLGRSHAS
jgi:ABC-type branched-subunit amino acid transport system ATPase component